MPRCSEQHNHDSVSGQPLQSLHCALLSAPQAQNESLLRRHIQQDTSLGESLSLAGSKHTRRSVNNFVSSSSPQSLGNQRMKQRLPRQHLSSLSSLVPVARKWCPPNFMSTGESRCDSPGDSSVTSFGNRVLADVIKI